MIKIKTNKKLLTFFLLITFVLLATTVVSAVDSSDDSSTTVSDSQANTVSTSDQSSDISDSSSQATTSSNTQTTTNTHSNSDTASSTKDTTSTKTTNDTSSSNTNTNTQKTSDTQATSTQTTTKDTTSSQSSVSDVKTSSSDTKETNNTLTTVSSNLVDEKTQLKTFDVDGTTYTANSYDDLVSAVDNIKTGGIAGETYTILLEPGSTDDAYDVTSTITWGSASSGVTDLIIDGQNQVTIDGQGLNKFMTISSGYTLTLQNITIINCHTSGSGGAISNSGNLNIIGSTFTGNTATTTATASGDSGGGAINSGTNSKITIINSTFTENTATDDGGAIFTSTGDIEISNTHFENNKAGDDGGAIFSTGGSSTGNGNTITIDSSTFINNEATGLSDVADDETQKTGRGGAIFTFSTKLTVTDSTFTENKGSRGGAICTYYKDIVITNSDFNENTASFGLDNNFERGGGAIDIEESNFTLTESRFNKNTATSYGGAISIFYDNKVEAFTTVSKGNIIITDSNFTENKAFIGGGISFIEGSTTVILGSTTDGTRTFERLIFNNNTADDYGGGLVYVTANSDPVYLKNLTFYGNKAVSAGGLAASSSSSDTYIQNSTFINNTAIERGGGYYEGGDISELHDYVSGYTHYIQDCTFTGNNATGNDTVNGHGGAIYGTTVFTINNTVFANNSATLKEDNGGGAIAFMNEIVPTSSRTTYTNVIANSTFYNNTGYQGSSILFMGHDGDSSTERVDIIDNCTFQYDVGVNGIVETYNSINITNCEFSNEDETSQDNYGTTYGAALVLNGTMYQDGIFEATVNVINSTFANLKADKGGAIFAGLETGTHIDGIMNITNCNFTNCTAYYGGAIFLDEIEAYISNSKFYNNIAIINENDQDSGNGGAIYITGDDDKIEITGNYFENNIGNYDNTIYTTFDDVTNLIITENEIIRNDMTVRVYDEVTIYSPIIDTQQNTDETVTFTIIEPNEVERETITATIDEDTKAVYVEYAFDTVGVWTVNVEYDDSNNNKITLYIDVTKRETVLELDKISTKTPSDLIKINGTLKDADDTYSLIDYEEMYVVVYVNDEYVGYSYVDEDGSFQVEYTTVEGYNRVEAFFYENDIYLGSSDITSFEAQKNNTIVEIQTIPESIVNQTATIEFKLTDESNNDVIPNAEEFKIFIDGVQIEVDVSYNEQTESYSFDYIPTSTGEYHVLVEYAGNDTYTANQDDDQFTVNAITTDISINIDPNSVNPTDSIEIYGYVTSGDDKLNTGSVTLYVDGKEVTTTEDLTEDGKYTFTFTTTTNSDNTQDDYLLVALGNNNVRVVYNPAEGSSYAISENEATLTVTRIQPTITNIDVTEHEEINQTGYVHAQLVVADTETGIDGATITWSINGETKDTYTTTTQDGGYFTIEFSDTVAEVDYIVIIYSGDEKYQNTYAITHSDVYRIPTHIEQEEETEPATVGHEITIDGYLYDEYEHAVVGETLYLTDEYGHYTTSETDQYGHYSFSYTPTVAGETQVLTITFNGDNEFHNETSLTITIDVEKEPTTLILDDISDVGINSPLTITGSLTYGDNQPLTGETVTITITDESGDKQTYDAIVDSNGLFSKEITSPSTTGTYTVKVSYEGNTIYDESTSEDKEFSVKQDKTKITLDQEEYTTTIGQTITITGTLTDEDDNDNQLVGKTVKLLLDGTEIDTTVTTDNGYFEFNYHATEEITGKIQVVFEEDNDYLSSESETAILTVNKIDTILGDVTATATGIDGTLTITGTLTDTESNSLVGETVTITITGDDYTFTDTATVGSDGYKLVTTAPANAGKYSVTVTYSGSTIYAPTEEEATGSFDLDQLTTSIITQGEYTTTIGNTITITGELVDENNKLIPYAEVKLMLGNEVVGSDTTDENGLFNIKYDATILGSTELRLVYDGDTNYVGNTADITVVTETIPTQVTIDEITVESKDEVTITGTLTANSEPLSSQEVYLYINDVLVDQTTTTVNGEYTFTTDKSDFGNNKVEVRFEATGNYAESSATDHYAITDPNAKTDTTITVSDIADITIGDSVTITGTLQGTDGVLINGAEIIITINGKDYTATTNSQGVYTLTPDYVPTATGNYTVVVQYDGDTTYNPSHTSTTFNVNKDAPTITVEHIDDIKINDSVTITGFLSDENGALANKEVTIIINDETYYNTTDSNGRYSYNYTPESTGSYSVLVEYPESDANKETHAATAFYTDKLETTIRVDDAFGYEGQTVDLVAYVYDENGNPVSEGKVAFKLNDVTITDDNGNVIYVDVIDGVATLPYTITNHAANYTITGLYYGSDNYYTAKSEDYGNLEVKKASMNTRVLVNDTTAQYGDTIELAAQVLDEDGNIVTSGKVVFKLNGVSLKYENGDVIYVDIGEDGYARLKYTITNNPKIYTVTAVYSGDGYYITSRNTTATLNVTNRVVDMTVDSATGKSGDTVTLTATIKEDDMTYTDNGVVVFKINGVTIRDDTGDSIKVEVKDGIASYDYEIPVDMAGKDYNITAVYSNKNYDRAEANNTLTVERSEVKTSITPLTTTKGSDTTISTVLYDENGNQLERSTKVAIKINGKTVVHTTTENGILNVTIPTEELSKGDYNIEVVFGENSAYYEKRLNTTLTIV